MGRDRVLKDRRQAMDRLLEIVEPRPVELLPPVDCVGLVLASDVQAVCDVPEVACSARDGYALCSAAALSASAVSPLELVVQGLVPAESVDPAGVVFGHAARVLTGAPVPDGTDAVVADEDVRSGPETIKLDFSPAAGTHVIEAGKDIACGSRIARGGDTLTPQSVAVMVRSRVERISVHPAPRAAVFVLGSELADPYDPGSSGRMPADNAVMASELLLRAGFDVVCRKVLPDDVETLRANLAAVRDVDLVVTTGGTGGSERDGARQGALAAGFSLVFGAVNIRPGKGMFAMSCEGRVLLGLPGPPGAVFACLHAFLPALGTRLRGAAVGEPVMAATGRSLASAKEGEWMVPCRIERCGPVVTAHPLSEGLESFLLLAQAEGVLAIPHGPAIPVGGDVELLEI